MKQWVKFLAVALVITMTLQPQSGTNLIVQLMQNGTVLGTRSQGLLKFDCTGTATFTNNTYTCTSGGGAGVPSGSILLVASGGCPATYSEVAGFDGKMLLATTAGSGGIGTTGGADAITPTGTVSTPAFTGSSANTSLVSAGTPAGTNSAPALTMNSYTPAGSNGTAAFTPAGTVAAPVFTGSAGTVPAQVISYPVNVPTNSAITMSGSTANESAHTHSVTAAGTNGTSATTATGTVATPVIAWPAGVPTSNAITMSGSTATESAHTHGAGTLADATSGSVVKLFTASASGVSAATLSGSTGAGSAHSHAIGTIAASTPTLSWPAGVPTSSTPTFTGSSSSVSAQTFTGSAVTSGAGSAHLHAVGTLAASTPAISWPANPPTNGTAAFTPAGTNSIPAFTGSAGTVPGETFTGNAATLTGSVAAPTFTGSALGTHQHTLTATGTNSTPTFTGDSFDNRSAWIKVIYCQKA